MEILSLVIRHIFSDENKAIFLGSVVGGWIYSIHLLTVSSNAELAVKFVMGLVMAGITGFMTVLGKDFYQLKIKRKLFKNDRKEREDSEKRA